VSNRAATALFEGAGARRVASNLELVLRGEGLPGRENPHGHDREGH